MAELFVNNPWLIVCILTAVVIVACVAIAVLTEHFRAARQAEIDATLKHLMLERGMTAADIKTVLEASSNGEAARQANQPVRVGFGKFQVEVGSQRAEGQGTT